MFSHADNEVRSEVAGRTRNARQSQRTPVSILWSVRIRQNESDDGATDVEGFVPQDL